MKQERRKRTRVRTLVTSGSAVIALACIASPASAADFSPNSASDDGDGVCDASCTLRDAVLAANAAPGADRVLLSGNTTYTLTRGADATPFDTATGDLDVADGQDLQINGAGVGTTVIRQTGNDRVLEGGDSAGVSLVVRDLTITGGSPANSGGGGVSQQAGTLTLERVSVDNNIAPRGGGVAVGGGGNVILTDVSLTNNTARPISSNNGRGGGGLEAANTGSVSLKRVTVAGNVADGVNGGGIWIGGGGPTNAGGDGGARNVTGENVTISGNRTIGGGVGGGLFTRNALANVSLKFATISGNTSTSAGNGIFKAQSVSDPTPPIILQSTIIDNDGSNNCVSQEGAAINSGPGGNVARGVECALEPANNRQGVTTLAVGPLGNYGPAGTVQTVPLRRGNSALGFGSGCTQLFPQTDARLRPRAATCDSGAHEQERTSLSVSATATDPVAFGGIVTYNVTVTAAASNPIPITGIQLGTGVAPQATFIDTATTSGSCRAPDGEGSIRCTLAESLAPGQSVGLTLRVRVDRGGGAISTGFNAFANEPNAQETVSRTSVITGGPGTPPAGTPPTTPPGTTPPGTTRPPSRPGVAPRITLRASSPSKRTLRRLKRLSLRVRANERCTVALTLTLSGRTLGRTTVRFTKSGERRVTLKLGKTALSRIRRAKTNSRLILTARATDTAGNRSVKRSTLRLKR